MRKGVEFTDKEDKYIVRLVKGAVKKNEQISISAIVKKMNGRKNKTVRTRPAVNHRVQILIREGKITEATIVKGKDKTPYTKDEDRVLVAALKQAVDNGTQVSMRQLTDTLAHSTVSPIARTEPSVRARVKNVLLTNDNLAAIHSRTSPAKTA